MARRGDKHDLRIRWIDDDAIDGLCFLEPEVSPRFPAIGRAPHAITNRRTLPIVGLAGSDVNNIRIGGSNADRTDRLVLHVVELGMPMVSSIGRFPESTGCESDVHDHRILFRALNIIK